MPTRIAEQCLVEQRALEVEVAVVLPGKTNTAVHLQALLGDVDIAVAGVEFCLRCGNRRLFRFAREGFESHLDTDGAGLRTHHHVDAAMFQSLKARDRATELLAPLHEGDRRFEHLARASHAVRCERAGTEFDEPFAKRLAVREITQHRLPGNDVIVHHEP